MTVREYRIDCTHYFIFTHPSSHASNILLTLSLSSISVIARPYIICVQACSRCLWVATMARCPSKLSFTETEWVTHNSAPFSWASSPASKVLQRDVISLPMLSIGLSVFSSPPTSLLPSLPCINFFTHPFPLLSLKCFFLPYFLPYSFALNSTSHLFCLLIYSTLLCLFI